MNDIRIDNPAVSGHHALIINILNDSFLEDLNSTNGTYVNGKLIKKHALTHGDVITIGHHHLRFVDSQVEGAVQDEFEKTEDAPPRIDVYVDPDAVPGAGGVVGGVANIDARAYVAARLEEEAGERLQHVGLVHDSELLAALQRPRAGYMGDPL